MECENGLKDQLYKRCTHISNSLVVQNSACIFPNNELFIFFIAITSFESVFWMKTVKSRLFKKYLERRKLGSWFCFSLGWLHICEKKKIENCNSVGAGAQNTGKVSFWPNFDPYFINI